jgi:hypothetical protein
MAANEALAVHPRNELLFANIWQYKCTNLGDIEDERTSKNVSNNGGTRSVSK